MKPTYGFQKNLGGNITVKATDLRCPQKFSKFWGLAHRLYCSSHSQWSNYLTLCFQISQLYNYMKWHEPGNRKCFNYLQTIAATKNKYKTEQKLHTEMWPNAQRDGRPAEYRWHRVLNATVWLATIARVPCSNAVNIPERKTCSMQSQFCTWQNSVTGQQPPKMYTYMYQPRIRPNILEICWGAPNSPTDLSP